jgi:hypothetical protein
MDCDEFLQKLDAEVGEGNRLFVARTIDPD